MKYNKEIIEFVEQAHRVGRENLQKCSSGNMSWRVADDLALLSGTGSWLSDLKPSNVSLCSISEDKLIEGPKPSMEHGFHLAILRERKDVNVVLHFQSTYATTISCSKVKPRSFNVIAEIPCHCGPHIPIIPYYRPGSLELAKAVSEALREHDCVLMGQHGQAVCGKTFEEAFEKAVFFELACKIIVLSGERNYLTYTSEEIADMEQYILGKATK